VTGTDGHNLLLWDLAAKDQTNLRYALDTPEGSIQSVAFSHDGTRLATISLGNLPLSSLSKDKNAFEKNREFGHLIRLWDLTAGDANRASQILPTPPGTILLNAKLAFSPDGRFLFAIQGVNVFAWTVRLDDLDAIARSAAGRDLTIVERNNFSLGPAEIAQPPVKLPRLPAPFRDVSSKQTAIDIPASE
jgi:WD40 repeat protein